MSPSDTHSGLAPPSLTSASLQSTSSMTSYVDAAENWVTASAPTELTPAKDRSNVSGRCRWVKPRDDDHFDIFPVDHVEPPLLPGRLEDTHVCRQLGSGGFGVVEIVREYTLGEDRQVELGAHYVVKKFMRAKHGLEEAKMAIAACAAPDDGFPASERIVRLHSVLNYSEGLCIKYELCSFGDLSDFCDQLKTTTAEILSPVANSNLPEGFIKHVGRCLAEALSFLHDGVIWDPSGSKIYDQRALWMPIIHQDIKPCNILVSDPLPGQFWPNIKLGDIGCAHFLNSEQHPYPGTPDYQPADDDHNKFTDIWSLGAVLHKMVTGSAPIENPGSKPAYREDSSYQAAMLEYRARPRVVQSAIAYGYSKQMEALLFELLASKGNDRPTAVGLIRFNELLDYRPSKVIEKEESDWELVFQLTMAPYMRLEENEKYKVLPWERQPTPDLPVPMDLRSHWGFKERSDWI